MTSMLSLLCSAAPLCWASELAAIPADIRAELAGLGLVDDAGPTAKGLLLVDPSTAPVAARKPAKVVVRLPAAPRIRDFEGWTAARRCAFERAGLDCRTPLGEFMAATVSAGVPAAWANCRIFGGIAHGPRSLRVPRAEYWPGGVYPEGMTVVDAPVETAARAWGKRTDGPCSNAGYEEWLARQGKARKGGANWRNVSGGSELIDVQPELLAAD